MEAQQQVKDQDQTGVIHYFMWREIGFFFYLRFEFSCSFSCLVFNPQFLVLRRVPVPSSAYQLNGSTNRVVALIHAEPSTHMCRSLACGGKKTVYCTTFYLTVFCKSDLCAFTQVERRIALVCFTWLHWFFHLSKTFPATEKLYRLDRSFQSYVLVMTPDRAHDSRRLILPPDPVTVRFFLFSAQILRRSRAAAAQVGGDVWVQRDSSIRARSPHIDSKQRWTTRLRLITTLTRVTLVTWSDDSPSLSVSYIILPGCPGCSLVSKGNLFVKSIIIPRPHSRSIRKYIKMGKAKNII